MVLVPVSFFGLVFTDTCVRTVPVLLLWIGFGARLLLWSGFHGHLCPRDACFPSLDRFWCPFPSLDWFSRTLVSAGCLFSFFGTVLVPVSFFGLVFTGTCVRAVLVL